MKISTVKISIFDFIFFVLLAYRLFFYDDKRKIISRAFAPQKGFTYYSVSHPIAAKFRILFNVL